MLSAILLAVACASPPAYTQVPCTRVDVIELQYVYDPQNEQVYFTFSQYIFWRWDAATGTHHVVDWCIWKPGQATIRRTRTGYRLLTHIGDRLLRVDARSFRIVHATYDRELYDRSERPRDQRSKLNGRGNPIISVNISE